MLKITNIQKSFNDHHVLKGIDFEINKVKLLPFWVRQVQAKSHFYDV